MESSHQAEVELPVAVQIAFLAAERLGLEAEVLDPEYRHLFEVRSATRRRVFLGGRSPLNDAVAARLAEDKHYTSLLLERAGVRVPRTVRCLSPHHPSLWRYREFAGSAPGEGLAETVGFPVVVKPNRLSHARGVRLAHDSAELHTAIRAAWELDAIALVQECVPGRDLRLDFLEGSYLAGYERSPIALLGDGVASLDELLERADPRMGDAERRGRLWTSAAIGRRLSERDLTPDAVLEAGQELSLATDIRNLNAGCSAEVVDLPEPAALDVCLAAGSALGLAHFGVDLKVDGATVTVIEVNASPLLSQLFLAGHRERVITAQSRVLRAALRAEQATL